MKSYTLYALICFTCATIGVILTLVSLEPEAWIGGIAISLSIFLGIGFAFISKRSFDTKEIKFTNKERLK